MRATFDNALDVSWMFVTGCASMRKIRLGALTLRSPLRYPPGADRNTTTFKERLTHTLENFSLPRLPFKRTDRRRVAQLPVQTDLSIAASNEASVSALVRTTDLIPPAGQPSDHLPDTGTGVGPSNPALVSAAGNESIRQVSDSGPSSGSDPGKGHCSIMIELLLERLDDAALDGEVPAQVNSLATRAAEVLHMNQSEATLASDYLRGVSPDAIRDHAALVIPFCIFLALKESRPGNAALGPALASAMGLGAQAWQQAMNVIWPGAFAHRRGQLARQLVKASHVADEPVDDQRFRDAFEFLEQFGVPIEEVKTAQRCMEVLSEQTRGTWHRMSEVALVVAMEESSRSPALLNLARQRAFAGSRSTFQRVRRLVQWDLNKSMRFAPRLGAAALPQVPLGADIAHAVHRFKETFTAVVATLGVSAPIDLSCVDRLVRLGGLGAADVLRACQSLQDSGPERIVDLGFNAIAGCLMACTNRVQGGLSEEQIDEWAQIADLDREHLLAAQEGFVAAALGTVSPQATGVGGAMQVSSEQLPKQAGEMLVRAFEVASMKGYAIPVMKGRAAAASWLTTMIRRVRISGEEVLGAMTHLRRLPLEEVRRPHANGDRDVLLGCLALAVADEKLASLAAEGGKPLEELRQMRARTETLAVIQERNQISKNGFILTRQGFREAAQEMLLSVEHWLKGSGLCDTPKDPTDILRQAMSLAIHTRDDATDTLFVGHFWEDVPVGIMILQGSEGEGIEVVDFATHVAQDGVGGYMMEDAVELSRQGELQGRLWLLSAASALGAYERMGFRPRAAGSRVLDLDPSNSGGAWKYVGERWRLSARVSDQYFTDTAAMRAKAARRRDGLARTDS